MERQSQLAPGKHAVVVVVVVVVVVFVTFAPQLNSQELYAYLVLNIDLLGGPWPQASTSLPPPLPARRRYWNENVSAHGPMDYAKKLKLRFRV